jgi:predicted ABC-type ATPase
VPTLTVIAGPNGSGKSTLTRTVEFDGRDRLLDPDAIARRLNPFNPSAAAIAAGREVLERTADYLGQGVSFAVETTLSSRSRVELIRTGQIPWVSDSPAVYCAGQARSVASHAYAIVWRREAISFQMPT